jgi:predicted CoA-binding protein
MGRMILLTSPEQHALLARSVRVAVVGASPHVSRPNYDVFHYLQSQPLLDVAPINAAVAAIDGIEAYPTLRAYARAWGAPDIVTVCRNPADAAKIAHQAIAVGAKAIWFQLGVATDEAIEIADRAGLDVVAERRIEVEFKRLAEAAERHHQRS